MKQIPRIVSLVLAITLLLSLSGCGASDGKTHLTFQIWDVFQRPGMQAVCDAYTAQHPDVVIEVQVTSWSEYWTKLEAAGESNTMPDIFWMHTDQILYYADFGILADLTDLYDEVDPNFWTEHYSQVSIGNASGSDGRMYGVPKDKDNVVLVYNMEMFDAAGVAYPDETWTWDDLMDASQKVYDATGKYGYMAYNDEQLGYWNFVYQNGGYILDPETNLHAGYTQPATADAIKYYVDIQKNEWCPDQTFFAETSPGTAFFSEMGCMFFEGSWNLLPELINYPNMVGKWDIAPLPKCPNPASGDGRGTISNGLCYATAANGKNLDVVKDVLRFFGSEEGQRIQGESGAAIPAYLGLEDSWTTQFQNYDYLINTQVCYDQFDSAVQYINNASRRKWKSNVADEMVKVYNGADLGAQLAVMQSIADQYVTD
ncbi:ABC transporter substrate-binding protein [Lawsonibacter sp. JLR.KK007]|uniref:ABC transporter substrate-binding protein n=1 Tax=Lawsonibacter sp. JLR.KK007 TaxID=3114293 RepID=UPI002FF2A1DA